MLEKQAKGKAFFIVLLKRGRLSMITFFTATLFASVSFVMMHAGDKNPSPYTIPKDSQLGAMWKKTPDKRKPSGTEKASSLASVAESVDEDSGGSPIECTQ